MEEIKHKKIEDKLLTSLTADELAVLLARQARLAGACDKADNVTDVQSLANLFFTPQGAEYCICHRFPSMPTWKLLAEQGVDKYGVYVNRGDLKLSSQEVPTQVALIGRTFATVECRGDVLHTIVVLRGASLVVDAYDWGVVRIWADPSAKVIRKAHGTAVII